MVLFNSLLPNVVIILIFKASLSWYAFFHTIAVTFHAAFLNYTLVVTMEGTKSFEVLQKWSLRTQVLWNAILVYLVAMIRILLFSFLYVTLLEEYFVCIGF